MYLPKVYLKFKDKYPEVFKHYEALGESCQDGGALDLKTRRLVNLGIAVGVGSSGGVKSQVRKALEAGASADEISHVALLALTTIGFPQSMAAMVWIDEVLEGA